MLYQVRVYCHASHRMGACECERRHPFLLDGAFASIAEANHRGEEFVAAQLRDDVEWEVLNEHGAVVC